MLKLSKTEREQIAKSVEQAELRTSGEITTAMIGQSYDYAIYELLVAVLSGLIYSVVIFIFSREIESWLQGLFWNYHIYQLTGFYLFSTFLVILIVYFLANTAVIDRLIVPKSVQSSWVKRRAMQHFLESEVSHTREGTGILIFISLLERRVELVADKGIAEKVSSARWQAIVDRVIAGIRTNRLAERLCESILECGELLAKDFPRRSDDVNELPDEIVEIDK